MQIFLMIFYPSADPKQISVHILNCYFHFVKNKSCDYHLSGVSVILYRTLTCLPSFYSGWSDNSDNTDNTDNTDNSDNSDNIKKPEIYYFFNLCFHYIELKDLYHSNMHCKTNREQFSMICNLIDHRNDVIMFKTFSVLDPSPTARDSTRVLNNLTSKILWPIRSVVQNMENWCKFVK